MISSLLALAALVSTPALAQSPLQERTVGIGIGTSFNHLPDSPLPVIDLYSARLQLTERVALEPELVLSYSHDDYDGQTLARAAQLGAGAGIRWYAASRGATHLVGLAGTRVEHASAGQEIDDSESWHRQITLQALLGLGVEWTPSTRWALSLDAQQPLASVTWAQSENDTSSTDVTAWAVGLDLQPRVSLMGHLYF